MGIFERSHRFQIILVDIYVRCGYRIGYPQIFGTGPTSLGGNVPDETPSWGAHTSHKPGRFVVGCLTDWFNVIGNMFDSIVMMMLVMMKMMMMMMMMTRVMMTIWIVKLAAEHVWCLHDKVFP